MVNVTRKANRYRAVNSWPWILSEATPRGKNYCGFNFETVKIASNVSKVEIDEKLNCDTDSKLLWGYIDWWHVLFQASPNGHNYFRSIFKRVKARLIHVGTVVQLILLICYKICRVAENLISYSKKDDLKINSDSQRRISARKTF
jgi:hypothetical protein